MLVRGLVVLSCAVLCAALAYHQAVTRHGNHSVRVVQVHARLAVHKEARAVPVVVVVKEGEVVVHSARS